MSEVHHFPPGAEVRFRLWRKPNAQAVCQETEAVFVVESFLSSGGQADTYAVHWKGTTRAVRFIMKHLYGNYATDKRTYHRKLTAMAQYPAPHPDLVWPVGISKVTDSGSFCFIMELLKDYTAASAVIHTLKCDNGQDAAAPTAPGTLTLSQRAELVYRTAAVMDALHSAGFVYGDLSGANVLYKLRPDGHLSVKLIDADNLIPVGQSPNYPKGYHLGLCGTGQYPAPEIITGKSVPSVHSDLHSLAVFAFRMFHGSHPLDGARTHSVTFTDDNIRMHFGELASFTLTDPGNAASDVVRQRWRQLPEPIQKYFLLAFAPDVLHSSAPRTDSDRESRPTAAMLMKCLAASFPNIV